MNELSTQERRRNLANSEEFLARLRAAAIDAVAVLSAGLLDSTPAIRIRAAVAILNLGTIATEIEELENRLIVLERSKRK